MDPGTLIVVALGGNAISQPHQRGTVDEQFANSRRTAHALADLVLAGHQLLITHGNGPQIGNFLLRNEAAADRIYPLPMYVAGAHVQGGMGYMIAQTLINELHSRGVDRGVTTVITTVVVNADDPSFADPTKPVGRALSHREAVRFETEEGWAIRETSPGQYRRVLASPAPVLILELEHIRRAVEAGELLVVCGGGGVPVVRDPAKGLRGVKAVIDKDLVSALLAAQLGAEVLLILTTVDRVRINFARPNEEPIDHMTLAEARGYLADGQFPAGSMGPKIQGAINFLEASRNGRCRVIIGPLDRATDAIAGRTGTVLTRD